MALCYGFRNKKTQFSHYLQYKRLKNREDH